MGRIFIFFYILVRNSNFNTHFPGAPLNKKEKRPTLNSFPYPPLRTDGFIVKFHFQKMKRIDRINRSLIDRQTVRKIDVDLK